jgi:MFS family permease
VLRNRSLAALLVAELVSTTGTTMTFLALPWFVLETTGSATRMSVVLAAELVPIALFGIPSGTLVGRLGARRTMLLGDALRAPLIALVPALHWSGHLSFGLLLAIVFVLGLFSAPYFASQRTIVPELFGDDETVVAKASALFGGATQLTIVFGPALGGVCVSWFDAPGVLLLDGATYLVAVALVALLVRGGRPVTQTDETRGILAGVRYLARDPVLGPLTLTVIVLDMAGAAIAVAIPLLAFVRYDESAHVGGWLFTAFGIGAVGGSVLVMKLLDRFRPLRLASAGIVLATLPLWLLAVAAPWPFVALALFACGVFVPFVNAPAMGLITTRPPAALRAKVMTCVMTASALGGPLGRLAVGPVFEWGGLGAMFVAVAGAMSVGAVVFVAVALRVEPGDEQVVAAGVADATS